MAAALLAGAAFAQKPPSPSTASRPQSASVPAQLAPPTGLHAKSWVLMDATTGRILAGRNADQRVPPGSITKIMTDYAVAAEIAAGKANPDDKVYISKHAWQAGAAGSGTASFLKVGSQVPLKDLLYGMIVQSGNAAAIALAEHVAGSEPAFARLMNAYAGQLGLSGTHYVNASGSPRDGQYTTARDVAVLSRALIRNFPAEYAISGMKSFTWGGMTRHNRNPLLWTDPSVDGIRAGHGAAAGYCLAASARRGDERLIAVVMGAPAARTGADDAEALLNYGFRHYHTRQVYPAGKVLATPRLWKGEVDALPVGLARPAMVTFARGEYRQFKASLDISEPLVAPYRKGQEVGRLRITLHGRTVFEQPLVALEDAPEAGLFSRAWDTMRLWFHRGNGKKDSK